MDMGVYMDMENNAVNQELPEEMAVMRNLQGLLRDQPTFGQPKNEFRQALRQRLAGSRLFALRRNLGAIWVVSLSVLWLFTAAIALGLFIAGKKKPSAPFV